MPEIDARLGTGELAPKLILHTELSYGPVLDIEFAPHVTVNGYPDGFREFARDLLDLVDNTCPEPPHPEPPPVPAGQIEAEEQDAAGDHQHRDIEGQ